MQVVNVASTYLLLFDCTNQVTSGHEKATRFDGNFHSEHSAPDLIMSARYAIKIVSYSTFIMRESLPQTLTLVLLVLPLI